ncbi:ATP-binding protein [Herbidospora cretacea]|uniref:ATP-binding protein n=1 Tax=Herbidospora cretacea TaxID=28444 RepID=UPI0007742D82|nr:ATP-binding protein [Herbidospora cretacea]
MNTDQHLRWAITTDLVSLRGRVTALATEAGLRGHRRGDLVTAVNEAVINVLEHGGGEGVVEIWYDHEGVTVEVTDSAGTLQPQDIHRSRPSSSTPRGFGLWLMGQLCDEFSISQMVGRSRIRLRMVLAQAPR